jgi:hypothetical protein
MALTTAQQVRLRIQDLPQVFDLTQYGNGSATIYQLRNGAAEYRNLTSATAYVPDGNGLWSATGATFNTSGYVAFSGVISANSAWRARGVHSVFSDDEIGHFTAAGGTVAGAALEAAYALQFDGLKRASWAAPDGTEYDDTKALQALKDIIDTLNDEVDAQAVSEGGFQSWSLNQGNW